jgi:hypothetical protein
VAIRTFWLDASAALRDPNETCCPRLRPQWLRSGKTIAALGADARCARGHRRARRIAAEGQRRLAAARSRLARQLAAW